MKIFNKLFLLLTVSCCLFTSCSDDDDYKPGEPVEGQGFYFPNTLSSKINLDSKASSFDVQVDRSVTGEVVTANLTVDDPSGIFTIPSSVDFPADAKSATIRIGYNPNDIKYDDYIKITLSLEGTGETTPYGLSVYTFEVGIPAPWVSLGTATFSDSFIFSNSYGVELQQNEDNPALFRLVDPYSEAIKEEGLSTKGNQSAYLTFKLLAPGDKVNDVTITSNGIVYFDPCCTGFYNTSNDYNKDINAYHPSAFTKFQEESTWQHSRVTHYKEDGTPGAVQLAPYYYMEGLGGYDQTQSDGMITILFPNYVIADYSVEVTYTGRYISVDESTYAVANITLGEDVESAKTALIEGNDVATAVAGIKDGSLETTEITKSGVVSLPCSNSGTYTFVVVSYGNKKPQENGYATFQYTTSGVSKWTSLGMASYTDAIVGAAYGAENVTYEVEIQESDDTPGLYRLVNPYGEKFPYNEKGDWDDSRNYYLEINATDPEGVFIAVQNTGLNWGDGNFYVYSEAAYYLDNGKTLEEAKAAGVCGKLENGIITFPAKKLFFGFLENSSDLYSTNADGGFKIELPSSSNPKSYSTNTRAISRVLMNAKMVPLRNSQMLLDPSPIAFLK